MLSVSCRVVSWASKRAKPLRIWCVQDLDLADEDYEKLEEKNGALVRVVTQLSSR